MLRRARPGRRRSGGRRLTVAALLALALAPAAADAATCTRTWDGGASTASWNDAANWSPDGVPGTADRACVPSQPSIAAVTVDDAVQVGSVDAIEPLVLAARLDLESETTASHVGNLSLTGGASALGGDGALGASGTVAWAEGTIDGAGTVTVESGAALSLTGSATRVLAGTRVLDIAEGAGATLAAGSLRLDDSATLSNSGVLDVRSTDPSGIFGSADGTLQNAGQITRTGAAGTTLLFVPVGNDGEIAAVAGTIELHAGGTGAGSFGAGAVLAQGTFALDDGATIEDGAQVGGGGAAPQVETAGVLTFSGTNTIEGGTVGGDGEVRIEGVTAWNGNTLGGEGALTIAEGATLEADPGDNIGITIDGLAATNDGTLRVASGVLFLQDATIVNGGTLELASTNSLPLSGGTVENHGTVTSSVTGDHNVLTLVTGDGLIEATDGNLQLGSGVTTSAGATLSATSGAGIVVPADSTLAGSTALAGEITLGADLSVVTIELAGTVDVEGHTTLAGGTVDGDGGFDVTGDLEVAGSFVDHDGALVVEEGATLRSTCSIFRTCEVGVSTIENHGTLRVDLTWLLVSPSSVIENSGDVELVDDTQLRSWPTAGAKLHNTTTGAARALAGATFPYLDLAVDNDGTVTAADGVLSLSGVAAAGDVSTGTYDAADGATVRLGGLQRLGDGAVLGDGSEIAVLGESETRLEGDVTATSPALSGGTLSGPGDLTVTDDVVWSGGALAGDGVLRVAPGATFTLDGVLDLRRTIVNAGSATLGSGTLLLSEQALVDNRGTFELSGASITTALPHRGVVRNRGLLRMASTDNAFVSAQLENRGVVEVAGGTLAIADGLDAGSAGTLRFPLAADGSHGQITVGHSRLGGRLEVTTAGGFVPAPGQHVMLIEDLGARTGVFATVATPPGVAVSYDATAIAAVASGGGAPRSGGPAAPAPGAFAPLPSPPPAASGAASKPSATVLRARGERYVLRGRRHAVGARRGLLANDRGAERLVVLRRPRGVVVNPRTGSFRVRSSRRRATLRIRYVVVGRGGRRSAPVTAVIVVAP